VGVHAPTFDGDPIQGELATLGDFEEAKQRRAGAELRAIVPLLIVMSPVMMGRPLSP
jgi:hypothetical protein